jgi:hypothetical protein
MHAINHLPSLYVHVHIKDLVGELLGKRGGIRAIERTARGEHAHLLVVWGQENRHVGLLKVQPCRHGGRNDEA